METCKRTMTGHQSPLDDFTLQFQCIGNTQNSFALKSKAIVLPSAALNGHFRGLTLESHAIYGMNSHLHRKVTDNATPNETISKLLRHAASFGAAGFSQR